MKEYDFVDGSADILVKAADGLFDWLEPRLPEDLCLLRSDGSPWLVTITHERDAYFVMSREEGLLLTSHIPSLRISAGM